jgi:alanine racemase
MVTGAVQNCWLEVDAGAFAHNIAQYKQAVNGQMLAAVIKSNAYGHGILEIARLCEDNPAVDFLCVAYLSEALYLRNQGIKKTILVLCFIDVDPVAAAQKNIHFMVDEYRVAEQLNAVGKAHLAVFTIHIKIDTGLSRFGVEPADIVAFIQKLQGLPHISIVGVATHFSESPQADQTFTRAQIALFDDALTHLEQQSITIPIKHAANSAGTGINDLLRCNLYRVGCGLYGMWPSEANKCAMQERYPWFVLKPVLTWKTRIIRIKEISSNRFIGYERTYVAKQPMRIALLPVGYADGYNPDISNKGMVLIGDQLAPIVGRIAMNIMIIDITALSDVSVGDEVIILGDHEQVRAADLAQHTSSNNPRFITTKISSSILRKIK